MLSMKLKVFKKSVSTALGTKQGLQSCLLIGSLLFQMLAGFNTPIFSETVNPHAYKPVSLMSGADPMYGILLPRQRTKRSLNQIYEFDRIPLGSRIPVLLVPGRAEEFQQDAWWKRFYRDSQKNAYFRHNFKMYAYLYNSKDELTSQAKNLATDVKKRFSHLPPNQPLMLVTYSLGGLISRELFKDPKMMEQVDTMLAIAVPFHGSPIFEPDWFSYFLNPPNRSPIRRFWDRSIYRAYMFDKANLTRGMSWDNFDTSKPQFQVNRAPEVLGDQVNTLIPSFQEYPLADEIRAKTVIYGSYLENAYTKTNQLEDSRKLPKYVVDNPLTLPRELAGTILPLYGFTVHSVMTYMNYQMANLSTFTPEDPQGANTHLYRFNDGAIPLSSVLFLEPRNEPYIEDLDALVKQAKVRKVRVFANIDHVDLGEYSLFKKRLAREDLIHPQEGLRTPNQWVLHDLIKRFDSLRQGVAVGEAEPAPCLTTP